jgi:hypothetical protein
MESSKFIGCILGWVEVGSREAGREVASKLTFTLPGFTWSPVPVEGVEGHQLFPVAVLVGYIKNIPDNSELHV